MAKRKSGGKRRRKSRGRKLLVPGLMAAAVAQALLLAGASAYDSRRKRRPSDSAAAAAVPLAPTVIHAKARSRISKSRRHRTIAPSREEAGPKFTYRSRRRRPTLTLSSDTNLGRALDGQLSQHHSF